MNFCRVGFVNSFSDAVLLKWIEFSHQFDAVEGCIHFSFCFVVSQQFTAYRFDFKWFSCFKVKHVFSQNVVVACFDINAIHNAI
jgi:hypothetical protein